LHHAGSCDPIWPPCEEFVDDLTAGGVLVGAKGRESQI
jgi:hypothetical protein